MNKLTVKEFNEQVESLTIDTDEQLENANYLAKECNRLIKEVKASYKDDIAKYHALHKEAKNKEKEALEPLETAKNIIKKAIGDYIKVLEQRKLELAKEQEAIFGEVLTVAQETLKLNGTHVRKTWKARIVDEDKVPVKFGNHVIRAIDMKALNDIAKFEQGQAKIDGVEFYQEESVVIR